MDPSDPPRRSALRAAWPWLLLIGAIALWMKWGGGGGALIDVGEPAPALEVPWSESDAPFSLADARGEVVVLAFWATWCPSCRREGPTLTRVAERGHRVIGVSVDEASLDAVERAARGFGMRYPIALATRADADRFGVELLPTIYVIDADGQVADTFTGTVGEDRILAAIDAGHQD